MHVMPQLSACLLVLVLHYSLAWMCRFRDNEMGAQEPQEIEIRRNVSK